MIYEKRKKVSFYDLEANGEVKITAILKDINEAAFFNAEDLGIGLEKTLETNLVFLISRIGININRVPVLNEEITIRTWPGLATRSLFKRYGEILDVNQEKIMSWETIWVLIDTIERRIKKPSAFPVEIPQLGPLEVTASANKIIIPPNTTLVNEINHLVKFSELDLNMHMNNAKYGDLILNVLSTTVFTNINLWEEIQFNYINEAKLNDLLTIRALKSEDLIYIHGKMEDKDVFSAIVRLKSN